MFTLKTTAAALALALALPASVALAQVGSGPNWPGNGPGPYSPYGAGQYGAANPYAQELNELATKDSEKHDACFKQANEKNLYREDRWKFMLDCMKK